MQPPPGAVPVPSPARIFVVMFIVFSRGRGVCPFSRAARSRRCSRRGPACVCSSRVSRSGVRRVSRAGRSRCLRRRGSSSWCSSRLSSIRCAGSAVRVEPVAFAGADLRRRVHRSPFSPGGRWRGLRPRAVWWWCSSRPPQPSGSMPEPLPARRRVVVAIAGVSAVRVQSAALAGADVRDRAHLVAPSAVGIDARALAGADRGRRVHPALPRHPLSSMRAPAPARTVLPTCMACLRGGRVISRSGPSPARGRRVPRCACSSPPHPLGSMVPPRAARSVVVVCMRASAVVVDADAGARADRRVDAHLRVSWSGWISAVGVDHGALPGAKLRAVRHGAPRRSAVFVHPRADAGADAGLVGHLVLLEVRAGRWDRSSTPRRRVRQCWCSSRLRGSWVSRRGRWSCPCRRGPSSSRSSSIPVSRSGRRRLRRRRGGAWSSSCRAPFSRWGRCRRRRRRGSAWSRSWSPPQPWGSMSEPAPAGTRVVVLMSVSSVGIDAPARAGAGGGGRAHGCSSGIDGVVARLQPFGSMTQPRRRGRACWCSSSALRVDAGTCAGADRGGGVHRLLLSRRGRCRDRGRRGGSSGCSWPFS